MKRKIDKIVDGYFSLFKGRFHLHFIKNSARYHKVKKIFMGVVQCALVLAILFSSFKFGAMYIKIGSASGGEHNQALDPNLYSVIYDSMYEMWMDTDGAFEYFEFNFLKDADVSYKNFSMLYYKHSNAIHAISASYGPAGKKISGFTLNIMPIGLVGVKDESTHEVVYYDGLKFLKWVDSYNNSNITYYLEKDGFCYSFIFGLHILYEYNEDEVDKAIFDIIFGKEYDEIAPPLPDPGEEEPFPGDDVELP